MSVTACTDENGLCGASNVGGDPCCSGLTCGMGRPKQNLVLPLAFSRLTLKTEDVCGMYSANIKVEDQSLRRKKGYCCISKFTLMSSVLPSRDVWVRPDSSNPSAFGASKSLACRFAFFVGFWGTGGSREDDGRRIQEARHEGEKLRNAVRAQAQRGQ
ncbi:hypothetical protein BDR06DRAFT_1000025 [Suillus hirtellus]|nr:hypothetical protein BDR06DRAFT_1000025 [Suillus hirtellus]